jgi:myo-inositol-1(or 4)-monophosphatase
MSKEILLKAAQEAGAIMQANFNGPFKISSKDTVNDLVTEVDKQAEAAIFRIIRDAYPDHSLLSEEVGEVPQHSPYKWIIDPIDGTVNYAHGVPICCVSIAMEKDGVIELGAVYNPFLEEMFVAERGKGATLNGKKIQVSEKSHPENAFLVTGFPYQWQDMPNDPLQVFARFIQEGLPVRRMGSAAIDLCWVACGRFDGFWEHHLNAWDAAAGFLIVEEAGGKVTDFEGNPYSPYQPRLLATNGKMHDALLKAVRGTQTASADQ